MKIYLFISFLIIIIQGPTERISLHSIADLPKFVESGALNNIQGLKVLSRFLSEDDDRLAEAGNKRIKQSKNIIKEMPR